MLAALWGVPLQMQRLLSSTTTKGGRTVEPSTVAPLARLARAAAVELAGLAERRCGGVRAGFRKGSGGAMRCGGERWGAAGEELQAHWVSYSE